MPLEEIIIGREPDDIKKYGSKGCIFIGKHIVGSGFETHLTNPVLMDVARPHLVLIAGKRGSGKSYTGAVIAEEIMNQPDEIKQNLCCILFDTMDIFWSMKNINEQAIPLLSEWGLKPKSFSTNNIIPAGLKNYYEKEGIPYDGVIALKPSELLPGDWALTFDINLYEPLGILLERSISRLQEKRIEYSIDDIISEIKKDEYSDEKEKLALQNRFMAAKSWGIFSKEATPIENLLAPGTVSVISVGLMEWNVRNLFLGLICRKIYAIRTLARRIEEAAAIAGEVVRKVPLTWIIIDEAHNYLPAEKETTATRDLLTIITQGRQPGISLVLITQRPMKLHETAIAQSDIVIAHRLTAKPDLDALSQIMQTYALEDIKKLITDLPKTKGCAVILDDNSERLFSIQIRPRQSWHAGGTPSVFK
ncbi:MAG: ATP-binding protein [Candidatus Micrarchaeia archaeon]